MARLNNNIRTLMKQYEVKTGQPLNQKALSEATGINQSTISRYVNDRLDSYHKDIIEKLCQFFGVGIEDLLPVVLDEEELPRG